MDLRDVPSACLDRPCAGALRPGNAAPRRLPALTSLRFLAATLVVLWHVRGNFSISHEVYGPFQLAQAVSFFFVLSGFILTHSYPRLQGRGACRRFWLARFARIWPAHALAVLLIVVVFRHYPTGPLQMLGPRGLAVLNLSLLHAWVPVMNAYASYNGASWSISVEAFFYLLFPLLIWRLERTWHVKLLLSLGLVGALLAYTRWADIPWDPAFADPTSQVTVTGLCYFNPAARLFEFTLGMVTALLWRRLPAPPARPTAAGTVIEAAVLTLTVAAMYYTVPVSTHPWVEQTLGRGAVTWLMVAGVVCVPFALLIGVLACERGWLSRLLSWSPLVFLGEISYAIYILHLVVFRWLLERVHRTPDLPRSLVLLGYAVALLVLPYLVWRFVERPARSFLLGLWPRPAERKREATPDQPAHRAA